jgi:hypothetical protein
VIGRGHVTFLDDDAVRVIMRYVRDGVLRRSERDGIDVVDPEVIALGQIAAKPAEDQQVRGRTWVGKIGPS